MLAIDVELAVGDQRKKVIKDINFERFLEKYGFRHGENWEDNCSAFERASMELSINARAIREGSTNTELCWRTLRYRTALPPLKKVRFGNPWLRGETEHPL